MIYLDHLTTTPPLPEVVDAMQPWLRAQFGAAASLHKLGLEARDAIDESRTRLAKLVNAAEPEEIIFTSSGTEAINHAVKGVALANHRFGSHIVTTGIEHPAVLGSIAWLESQGIDPKGKISIVRYSVPYSYRGFKAWEADTPYFEGCLPIEVMAERGPETLRFGPLKPVGLTDPRSGRRAPAVVQLRQDNALGTLYNMVGFQTKLKYGAQVAIYILCHIIRLKNQRDTEKEHVQP